MFNLLHTSAIAYSFNVNFVAIKIDTITLFIKFLLLKKGSKVQNLQMPYKDYCVSEIKECINQH